MPAGSHAPTRPAAARDRPPPSLRRPSRRPGAARAGRTRRRAGCCRRGRPPTPPRCATIRAWGTRESRRQGAARPRGRSGDGSSRRRRRCRVEARRAHRRHDRLALVLAHRTRLVVEPLPDPRLDEHAPGGRLDHQAVERLEQAPVLVELALRPRAPQDPRHGPEDRAGVRAERARPARARPASRRRGRRSSRPRRGSPWPSPPSAPPLRPRSKSRGRPTPSARTGPGTSTRAPCCRTAARPASSSGRS